MALKAGYQGLKSPLGKTIPLTVRQMQSSIIGIKTNVLDGFTIEEVEVDEPSTINTNSDTLLAEKIGTGLDFYVLSALWQNKNNNGWYSGVGNATIAFNTTLRLNTASADYLGKKCRVTIACKPTPKSRMIEDNNRNLTDPEPETRTVKKTTKKTTTDKEGE